MKPQRFWASQFADGGVNYQNIWASRAAAQIDASRFNEKIIRVEVRVVKPKARKARKVRRG